MLNIVAPHSVNVILCCFLCIGHGGARGWAPEERMCKMVSRTFSKTATDLDHPGTAEHVGSVTVDGVISGRHAESGHVGDSI